MARNLRSFRASWTTRANSTRSERQESAAPRCRRGSPGDRPGAAGRERAASVRERPRVIRRDELRPDRRLAASRRRSRHSSRRPPRSIASRVRRRHLDGDARRRRATWRPRSSSPSRSAAGHDAADDARARRCRTHRVDAGVPHVGALGRRHQALREARAVSADGERRSPGLGPDRSGGASPARRPRPRRLARMPPSDGTSADVAPDERERRDQCGRRSAARA